MRGFGGRVIFEIEIHRKPKGLKGERKMYGAQKKAATRSLRPEAETSMTIPQAAIALLTFSLTIERLLG